MAEPDKLTPEERQAALDNISDEDLAKIQQVTGSTDNSVQVDEYWLVIVEFTKHFGWPAYQDFKADKIETDEMMTMIAAARKLDHLTLYNNARAVLIGTASANSKSPSSGFKKLTERILKAIRPDDE